MDHMTLVDQVTRPFVWLLFHIEDVTLALLGVAALALLLLAWALNDEPRAGRKRVSAPPASEPAARTAVPMPGTDPVSPAPSSFVS